MPTPPKGLARRSAALWRDLTKTYDLRPDELRILEDACREMDLVDDLDAATRKVVDDGALTVKGSMGQDVAHPLIQEIRQHRTTVANLLGKLKLPDDVQAESRGAQAREAARARWGKSA